MTPVEIVRAMLAEYEQAPAPRSHTFAARRVLGDVIAALEQADTAPRLEWTVERRHVHRLTIATAKVDGFEATVQWSEEKRGLNAPRWFVILDGIVIRDRPLTGDMELGQRLAELVIHRERSLNNEIARVK